MNMLRRIKRAKVKFLTKLNLKRFVVSSGSWQKSIWAKSEIEAIKCSIKLFRPKKLEAVIVVNEAKAFETKEVLTNLKMMEV